jgi:hypothetical protein
MKSLSPSTKNNMLICVVVLIVIGLIVWCLMTPCKSNQKKIIVPIGNGQSVSLTTEQYQKLLKESYRGREGFYVSGQDYIPNVHTENEYTPMLSLYKPKGPTRVVPEPPVGPAMPIPSSIPSSLSADMTGMTGAAGQVEGYGNVFIDNFNVPSVDPEMEKYRQELTGLSPFFLNNGKIMNGETI